MLTSKQKIIIAISVIAVVGFFVFSFSQANRKNLEVDVLDVGQGDAILIKSQYGQNILIDGGSDGSVIKRLGENLPWWDRTIDLMVLTHPHDDHVAGEIDVLKRYKVRKIIYTGVTHTSPDYLEWLRIIKEKKVPLVIIDHEQTIFLGENSRLEILYPLVNFAGKSVKDLNDSSMVIKLVNGENKFLFTGDAGVIVERALTPNPSPATAVVGEGSLLKNDLSADVLKVGHHGSDTSTSEEFLNAVQPQIAVIPVGKDNQFGHPSLRTINKLQRIGAKILRTDLDGTVGFISDGKSINTKH